MKKNLLFIISLLFIINVNSQHKFNLEEVLKIKEVEYIITEIDSFLLKKADYGRNVKALNKSQQTYFLVSNLERGLMGEGFSDFYFYNSGEYSKETVKALRKIKAKKIAKIVKKANAEFKNGVVPKDTNKRRNQLLLIEKKAKEKWDIYRDKIFENSSRLEKLRLKFVLKNKADFKE